MALLGLCQLDSYNGWHAGLVTDMAGAGADTTVDESVEGMKATLERVSASDSGRCFRFFPHSHIVYRIHFHRLNIILV